jgi:hypothetical protein
MKKKCLSLFESVVQSDDYMKQSESMYDFLNRSAWAKSEQIRNLLEQWYSEYPSKQQNDVCQRFRNSDDLQHCGAFFELYCSALLHKQGYTIEAHPPTSKSTHPEFLVFSKNTPLFNFEARIATLGAIDLYNQVQLKCLEVALNCVDSPNFHIHLSIDYLPSTTRSIISIKQVRTFVENFLKKLNHHEVTELLRRRNQSYLPIKRWVEGEWDFLLELSPKLSRQQKQPGYHSLSDVLLPCQWTYDIEQSELAMLKKAIKDKADRYGDFGLPYIVGINALHSIEEKVHNTTFSSKGGLWPGLLSTEGKQRVSAVLFVSGLNFWTMTDKDITPILWHNPDADNPLGREIWQEMPSDALIPTTSNPKRAH